MEELLQILCKGLLLFVAGGLLFGSWLLDYVLPNGEHLYHFVLGGIFAFLMLGKLIVLNAGISGIKSLSEKD